MRKFEHIVLRQALSREIEVIILKDLVENNRKIKNGEYFMDVFNNKILFLVLVCMNKTDESSPVPVISRFDIPLFCWEK